MAIASSIAGAVIVKFLLTVQYGVFVSVAVIIYVPPAKPLIVIGPLLALFVNGTTVTGIEGFAILNTV
ncbi:hypothetical protein D3C72_1710450 [compost metagenome]